MVKTKLNKIRLVIQEQHSSISIEKKQISSSAVLGSYSSYVFVAQANEKSTRIQMIRKILLFSYSFVVCYRFLFGFIWQSLLLLQLGRYFTSLFFSLFLSFSFSSFSSKQFFGILELSVFSAHRSPFSFIYDECVFVPTESTTSAIYSTVYHVHFFPEWKKILFAFFSFSLLSSFSWLVALFLICILYHCSKDVKEEKNCNLNKS